MAVKGMPTQSMADSGATAKRFAKTHPITQNQGIRTLDLIVNLLPKRRRPWACLQSLLLWILVIPMAAQAAIDQHPNSALILGDAEYARVPAAEATRFADPSQLTDLAFDRLTADDWSQGITGDAYWIRFTVHNPSTQAQSWVLQYETSYLDSVVVYWQPFTPGAVFSAGLNRAEVSNPDGFSARPLDYRKPAIRATTDAGDTTQVWVRLQQLTPDAVSLRLQVSEERLFNQTAYQHTLQQGIFFGALGALILMTFALAGLLRKRLFLLYGVYLVLTALMWAKLSGLGYQYLWPNAPDWHKTGFHSIYLLTTMAAWAFSQHFFSLRKIMPRVNRLINGLLVVLAVGVFARFLGVYQPILVLSFVGLGSLLLLPVLGAVMWLRGNRYARWYTVGWLVYSLGLTISVLSASGNWWLPWGMNALAYTQAASLVEVLFLSLALADKLVKLELERADAVSLSLLDPLTGLGNRRQLTQAYQSLQARDWQRNDQRMALLMIDLDRFKAVNDAYGHDAGDQVLLQLADDLRRICRKDDTLVRFGGEEFAVLLQLTDQDAAIAIAERIRQEFADHPTVYQGQLIDHTLSIGVVEVTVDGALMSTRRMMQEADDALYYAKSTGRNSTVIKQDTGYQRCSPAAEAG